MHVQTTKVDYSDIDELVLPPEDDTPPIEADHLDNMVGEVDTPVQRVLAKARAKSITIEGTATRIDDAGAELASVEVIVTGGSALSVARPAFDWAGFGVKPNVRKEICEFAERIHQRVDRVERADCIKRKNSILIGRDLIKIRSLLPKGAFGRWIESEFDWVSKSAYNFIASADKFGDKPEIVAALGQTTLYKLAAPSTPPGVIEAVERDVKAGKVPTSAEVVEKIKQAKADAWKAKEAEEAKQRAEALAAKVAAMTPEEKQAFERSEKDKAMAAQEARELQEKATSERKQREPDEEGRRRKAIELAEWLLDQLGADFTIFCDRFDGASLELSEALKIVKGRSSGATPQGTIHAALALAA